MQLRARSACCLVFGAARARRCRTARCARGSAGPVQAGSARGAGPAGAGAGGAVPSGHGPGGLAGGRWKSGPAAGTASAKISWPQPSSGGGRAWWSGRWYQISRGRSRP